jgi:Cu2+-exporting ATPase
LAVNARSPARAGKSATSAPGRIRFQNERLHRRRELCQAVERELMSVLGIDNYKTSALTGSVLILYDMKQLRKDQLVEILDGALAQAEVAEGKDKADLHLPLCTASLPLAATVQFLAPPLLPIAAGLFCYTSIPTFRNAREVLFEEKRLGVDVLDAIVVIGCLGTLQIFPGTVLCWCLGFGRVLVKKTQDDSKRLLLNAFGKQPRYVWLYKDGVEVQVAMDRLQVGDVIVVNTGEVVPVDGFIKEGMAMLDQHALTGESRVGTRRRPDPRPFGVRSARDRRHMDLRSSSRPGTGRPGGRSGRIRRLRRPGGRDPPPRRDCLPSPGR